MIAAYIRVSSRSQNFATQKHALELAARARRDEIGAWYTEKRSAKKLERPELGRVRELARRGELGKLYVYRLDRLARSGIRDTLTVLDELKASGCEVVTVADGFDLAGPAAEIVVAVMAWAAQMERLAIGERIASARARVERQGGTWGRPRRVTPELERAIRQRKKLHCTIREIAAALKVPRSTVADVLSEKGAYSGEKKKPSKKGRATP